MHRTAAAEKKRAHFFARKPSSPLCTGKCAVQSFPIIGEGGVVVKTIDKRLTTNSEKALLFLGEPLIIQGNNNPGQTASSGVGA